MMRIKNCINPMQNDNKLCVTVYKNSKHKFHIYCDDVEVSYQNITHMKGRWIERQTTLILIRKGVSIGFIPLKQNMTFRVVSCV